MVHEVDLFVICEKLACFLVVLLRGVTREHAQKPVCLQVFVEPLGETDDVVDVVERFEICLARGERNECDVSERPAPCAFPVCRLHLHRR